MFPKLELRLREQVEKHALKILTGRPRKFTQTILEPEITHWVQQYVEPILADAQKELTSNMAHPLDQNIEIDDNSKRHNWHGGLTTIGVDIVAPIAAIMAGIGTMAAGIILSITTSFLGGGGN